MHNKLYYNENKLPMYVQRPSRAKREKFNTRKPWKTASG